MEWNELIFSYHFLSFNYFKMDFILYRHGTLEKEVVEFNTIEELLDFIDNNFKRGVIISIQHKAEQHVLYAGTPYDRRTMQEYTGVGLGGTE